MSTVLVTGGLGRSGRWIVDHLREDHDVVAADLDHPGFGAAGVDGVDFRAVDLTDFGRVADVVADVDPDAVVHWGAIPQPRRHAGTEVFENNVLGAYNALVAAGRAGADVVQASSESIYGTVWAEEPWLPDYLPIDEAHDLRPEDPYGASKETAETLGRMATRKFGIDVASIRPSWIQYPGEYACLGQRDDLAAGAGDFWSYVDVRDVVSMVRTALEAEIGGHEPYLSVAAENYLGRPTAEAIEDHYGEVPEDCDLEGDDSAFTTEKAAAELGWEPEHSYHSAADEDVPGPDLVA